MSRIWRRVQLLDEPCTRRLSVPVTPIDEGLQKFADWVKDCYADRPVLKV